MGKRETENRKFPEILGNSYLIFFSLKCVIHFYHFSNNTFFPLFRLFVLFFFSFFPEKWRKERKRKEKKNERITQNWFFDKIKAGRVILNTSKRLQKIQQNLVSILGFRKEVICKCWKLNNYIWITISLYHNY